MSKKSVSALVGGMGLAMSIITSLVQKAKAKGLSDEDFHLLGKPEGEPLLDRLVQIMVDAKAMSANCFKVTVDYTKPLAEMIAARKCIPIAKGITPEHFPFDARAPEKVEIFLVHFDSDEITTKVILAKLDKRNLRPATLPELLALGVAYPCLQRDYLIVALGSWWLDPKGHAQFPNLGSDAVGDEDDWVPDLDLSSDDFIYESTSTFKFAAVRK